MRLLVAWVLLVGLADGATVSVAAEPSVTAATFTRSDFDGHVELRWRSDEPRRWSGRAEVAAAESLAADVRQLHPLGIDGPTNLTPGPVLVGGIFGDSERSVVWSPPQRRSLLSAGEGRWVETATSTGGIGFRARGHLQDRLRVWLDRNDPSASPAIDIELAELRYLEPREFEVAPGVVLTLQQTTPPLLRVTLGRGETVLTNPSKLPVRLDVSASLARQLRAVLDSDGESSGYGLWLTVTFAEPARDGAARSSVAYEAALPVRIEGDRLVTDNLQLEGDFPEGAYDAIVALVYGDYSAGVSASRDTEVWSSSLSKAVRSAIPGLALPSLPGSVLPEGMLPSQGAVRSGRICQTEFSVAVFVPRQQGADVSTVIGTVNSPKINVSPKIGEAPSPGVVAIGGSAVGGEAWMKLGPARWQGISAAAARVLPAAAVQWMAGATRRNQSLKFTSHEGVRLLELEPGQKAAFVAPVLAPDVRHRAVLRIPRGSAMQLAVMPLDGEASDSNRALGQGAVILRNGYDDENRGWHECEVDYWPRSDSVLLMISNVSIDRRARFGEIEVLAEQVSGGDGLGTPAASSPINAKGGRLACMQLDLRELFEQFGERGLPTLTRPLDYDDVLATTRRLMAAMRREGYNGLILTVASDGDALYPLEGWRPPASWDANGASTAGGVDALEAILRSFDGTGLKLIPCILPGAPDGVLEKQLREYPTSAAALTLTSPLEGQMGTWRFDAPDPTSFGHYDPTHPAVAKRLAEMIGNLRRRCEGHTSVHAIGLMADERSSLRLPPVEMTDEDSLEMFRLSLGDQAPARGALADYLRRSKYEPLELWLGQRVAAGILQGVRELGDWPLWVLSSDSALPPYLVSIAEHERITTARLHRRSLIEPIHRRVRDEACNASIPVGVGAAGTALLHELAIFRQPLSDSPAEGNGLGAMDELVGGFGGSSAMAEGSIRFSTLLDDVDASVMSGQLLTRSDRLAIAVGGGGVNQDGGEIRRRSLRRYTQLPPVLMQDVLLTDMAQSSVRLREGEYQGDAYYYVTNVTRWPVAVDVVFAGPVRGVVIEPTATSVVTSKAPQVTAAAPIELGKIWRVELAAGELAAIRIPGAGCKVIECDVRFAGSAGQIANIRQCVQDALDLSTQLAKNEPIHGLVNLGFEQVTPQGIPGWLAAQHPPDCVQVDAAVAAEGKRSLRLTNGSDRASAAWVVSQVLSPPTTGRLGVAVKLFALPQNDSEPGKPLEVRLALEGTVGGTPIRQTETVSVPRTGQWGNAVGRIEIARLPNLPVESLRLTVDMTEPGMVWLDDVGFYDGFLTAGERTQWDHLVYLAASSAARGDFLPASRLLDSHWSVKLRRPEVNVFAVAQPLDPKVWSDPVANKPAPSEGDLADDPDLDDTDSDGEMVAAPFSKESIARASYATEPAQGDGSKGGAGLRGQADSGDESQSGAAPTVAGPVGPKDKPDKPSQTERERGFLQRLRGWLPLRANAW